MSKNWVLTPVVLIALAGLSYGLYLVLQPPPLAEGLLYGNGHIEGTEVVVSAELAGRVVESRLKEGQLMQKGDLLIQLDDVQPRLQLEQAEAQTTAIQRSEAALKEQLDLWRHHLSTAQSDLARYRELRRSGTVTPQQLNQAEDRFREAQGRVGTLQAQIAEARARLSAAGQQVALLQQQLARTGIHAPVTGTVQTKAVETGELAAPGWAVAVLVDLSHLELKVYIPEGDIGKVKLGDTARIKVDAFPDRYFEAVVSQVDQRAQFTPRDVHLPQERVRMVFGVTLTLDNPQGWLKPGMPADDWIRWQDGAVWPERLVVPG